HTRSDRDWSSDVCSSDLLHTCYTLIIGASNPKSSDRKVIIDIVISRPSYDSIYGKLKNRKDLFFAIFEARDRNPNTFNSHQVSQIGRASCRERVYILVLT